MTELSSWSPLQELKFNAHRNDPLSLYENKYNKWSKFTSGLEKNSFSDKLHRSKSKSRKHNSQREEHSRRPRYEYTSNSVTKYDTTDNKTSPRRQRKRRIKAEVEDIPEVAEGDVLNNRYCVISKLGEGGFSLVVKCYDRQLNFNVAVKLQRIKYSKDAKYEIETLDLIAKEKIEYPNDPCYAIHLLDSFEFKNSYCMVFPLYNCTLLDLLNEKLKHTKSLSGRKNPPFTIQEIKHYARQLLQTVSFLYEMDLTHADIKPENILISDNGDICLTDFGLAVFSDDYHSPVTGTRQYSPPEIILEYGWDHSLDIWSVACLIAELYLGRPLFQTHENLEHLALMQEVLGPIPSKIIEYTDPDIVRKYFYSDNTLRWPEDATDVASMQFVAETLSLKEQILDEDLASLLSSMLHYDPEKRISAKVALAHKFFN